MYTYTAIVEKIIDGDTIDLRIDLGFDTWIIERARLTGIDAPETRTKDKKLEEQGELSLKKLQDLIKPNQEIFIRTEYDRFGRFNRVSASLYLSSLARDNNESVNEWMVKNNYAIQYIEKDSTKQRNKKHYENRKILVERGELSDKVL